MADLAVHFDDRISGMVFLALLGDVEKYQTQSAVLLENSDIRMIKCVAVL